MEDKKLESDGGFLGLFNIKIPIDRETFLHGCIAILLLDFSLSFFVDKLAFLGNILAMILVPLIVSYLSAIWFTKRLFHIWSKTKTRVTQVILFILIFISYVSLIVESRIEDSLIFEYFYFLLPLLFILSLFLLFKKGKNHREL